MPFYNFECTNKKCKHQFEDSFYSWDNYLERGDPPCPKCGKKSIKIMCCINGEQLNILYKGLPFGNGSQIGGRPNLRNRYPKRH